MNRNLLCFSITKSIHKILNRTGTPFTTSFSIEYLGLSKPPFTNLLSNRVLIFMHWEDGPIEGSLLCVARNKLGVFLHGCPLPHGPRWCCCHSGHLCAALIIHGTAPPLAGYTVQLTPCKNGICFNSKTTNWMKEKDKDRLLSSSESALWYPHSFMIRRWFSHHWRQSVR